MLNHKQIAKRSLFLTVFLFIAFIIKVNFFPSNFGNRLTKNSIGLCNKAKEDFRIDSINEEFKYYHFSEGSPTSALIKKLNDKNIEFVYKGCVDDSHFHRYNEKLNEYLIRKFNDSTLFEIVH